MIIDGERGRNRTFNLLIKSSQGSEEPDISSHHGINDLPTTEPARKRYDLVLKRSTLAHIGGLNPLVERSSRQNYESCEVKVLARPIACSRADSISHERDGPSGTDAACGGAVAAEAAMEHLRIIHRQLRSYAFRKPDSRRQNFAAPIRTTV